MEHRSSCFNSVFTVSRLFNNNKKDIYLRQSHIDQVSIFRHQICNKPSLYNSL